MWEVANWQVDNLSHQVDSDYHRVVNHCCGFLGTAEISRDSSRAAVLGEG